MGEKGRLQVLEYGELRKDVGSLKRASDAHAADAVRRRAGDVAAVEQHLAAIGAQMAGDQVEKGRLAGAVRPDHCGDLAGRDGEADPADGGEAGERLAQVAHLKHRVRPGDA